MARVATNVDVLSTGGHRRRVVSHSSAWVAEGAKHAKIVATMWTECGVEREKMVQRFSNNVNRNYEWNCGASSMPNVGRNVDANSICVRTC